MWIKKLFNQKQENTVASQKFQSEDTNEESHPLIDLSPDLRYDQLLNLQKSNLPFPHTLLHDTEALFLVKTSFEDGFTARQTHNDSFTPIKIVITDKQFIICPNVFRSKDPQKVTKKNYLDIMHGHLQKLEIKEIKKEPLKLVITLKDSRQIIIVNNKKADSIYQIQQLISKFAFVKGINKFYAFRYRKLVQKDRQDSVCKGWEVYDVRKEFARQGVLKFINLKEETQYRFAFKLVKNYSFDFSPTYPMEFFVPAGISNQELSKVAKFRTKQRVPALSYFYQYKPESYSCIFRCSQIKTGLMGNRCQQDEKMIKQIVQSINHISKWKRFHQPLNLKVYDARGYYAALGNMFAGKGYEKEDVYNCEVQFLNIPNIHAVRDSYSLVKAADHANNMLNNVLMESGWTQYVSLILAGAKSMATDLIQGKNVLVHCSDGWDRTSQLSSLAQLLLDPYYRTLQGFAVLIQKEWRQFGHKYRQRTGQYHSTNYLPYQKSQVFIQFLDCVYQIQQQFPLYFQYNHQLLQFLAIHVDSSIYGTFLTNNMKQTTQLKIKYQTISIWTDVIFSDDQKAKSLYTNPVYQEDMNVGYLKVNVQLKNMNIWKDHLLG